MEAQGMPALEALGKIGFVVEEVFHLLSGERLKAQQLGCCRRLLGPVWFDF
ncbi:hypothetical protein [Geomobilimonas luticola]|uniref:Uncharacterized protein n=1 Tax=Geomobilimonas luticola TaxID=1114878 RepID=A0ABS5SG33_9BACT|nr:hypothetical protein [Geomobilimonas luticola]MBT0654324.1 hypothetical protein [Geomobilimonas luticola]